MNRRGLIALAAFTLVPFGPLSERLHQSNPWRSDYEQESTLLVVRAQSLPQADCETWSQALMGDPHGVSLPIAKESDWEMGWKQWEPTKQDDREDESKDARKCDHYPCGVKFNSDEVKALGATPEDQRYSKFLTLVRTRVEEYKKSGIRKEYEFPGEPVDPWGIFEKAGMKSLMQMPTEPNLWSRRLDLAHGKMKALHQILDVRQAQTKGVGAVVWVRDAYTDHYFDGWGEWGGVSCQDHEVQLLQALFVDLDLLKKHDFFSVISRGKMKDAVKEMGQKFLDGWFTRIEVKATAPKAPSSNKHEVQGSAP